MARFCSHCGAPVTSRFCKKCGTPSPQEQAAQPQASQLQPQRPYCAACGEKIISGKRFCRKCGALATGAAQVIQSDAGFGGSVLASVTGGEMRFDFTSPVFGVASGIMSAVGTGKALLSGLTGLLQGFVGAFKTPKALIIALILGLLWLLQTLLPVLGVSLPEGVAKALGFLTFAQGGMQGGLIGMIGGIIGKGVFAGCAASLVGGGAFGQIGGGVKAMFSSFSCKSGKEIGLLLCGAGAALAGYNLMAGSAGLSDSMAAVSALLLSLRAMESQAGFLRQLAGSLVSKTGTAIHTALANRLLGGFSAGFALALPLSVLPFGYICYGVGVLLLTAGIVLAVTEKGR